MPSQETGSKRRLWVVTELYYPEETSTGYYLTRIAEGLAATFDVKVICGQPNYFARGITAPRHEFHRDVEIFRASGTRLNKNVIPFRLVNMLTLGLSTFQKAVANFRKGDRVLVVTNPPSMPFICAIACLIRGASYTLLIHDNYPEILVAAGKSKDDSWVVRTMDRLNRWLYKYAAKIIVVGRDMKTLVQKKAAGLNIPVETIPNWAELETVEPRPREENALLQELDLADKFVLLYAGNMGHPNDMESIVEAASLLLPNPVFHFVFIGTGAKRAWLEKEVSSRELSNITVLDPMPRSAQITFLNACDVALVSLVDKMYGVSMPSRTYNALAAGKPIIAIADHNSEVGLVVHEEGVGCVVPPHDPDALRDAIVSLQNRRRELTEMGQKARSAAVAKYSMADAIEKYRLAMAGR